MNHFLDTSFRFPTLAKVSIFPFAHNNSRFPHNNLVSERYLNSLKQNPHI